ncbi:MAG: ribonuclease P protein component [Synechococcales bacterium]|nr:ribonuclease P protein component [Synechococcales bacterium]
MSLPKVHRLTHRRDFARVYQSGSRFANRHLVLRLLKEQPPDPGKDPGGAIAPDLKPTQFGISISQKVSKRATVRNRIKRQIKAAIRDLLPRMAAGWRIVIVVRPPAVQCDYWQFLRELEQMLIRAEVINGHSRRGVL